MTKVCHMTIAEAGAIPRILKESETALKMGMEVWIVCIAEINTNYKKNNINFLCVQKYQDRTDRVFKTDKKIYQAAKAINADIYQIHDPELLRYSIKLHKKRKKIIFDSHEFYRIQIMTKPYISPVFRKIVSIIYNYYEYYYCKKVDAVLSVCTINGKSYFEDRCKKEIMIENVPALIPKNHVKKDYIVTKRVIYAGWISYERGVLYLAKAAKLAGVTLVLCGYFSNDKIKEDLLRGEYSDNIEYRGVLPREELYEVFKTCDLGACTLLSVGQYDMIDTLPTKVYEYMMVGLPVIMTNTRINHKMNEKFNFGICVAPDDVKEIADAFNSLIENSEKMYFLGQNGRTAVERELNWEIQEKKLKEIYCV